MALLAATPGPANLFAVANGASRGKLAAVVAALGMNTASLVWFGAAALGLGALVVAFPRVFAVVAVLGGLYVAWLGLQSLWVAWRGAEPTHGAPRARSRNAFRAGFLVQILNPKAVLFFTAVLPPFLDPARPAAPQLALFAVAMIGLDMLSMTAYGLGGAALAARMSEPRFRRTFDTAAGLLLLTAAAMILLNR